MTDTPTLNKIVDIVSIRHYDKGRTCDCHPHCCGDQLVVGQHVLFLELPIEDYEAPTALYVFVYNSEFRDERGWLSCGVLEVFEVYRAHLFECKRTVITEIVSENHVLRAMMILLFLIVHVD